MVGAWQKEKTGLPNGWGKSCFACLDAVIFTATAAILRPTAGNLPGFAAKFSPPAGKFTDVAALAGVVAATFLAPAASLKPLAALFKVPATKDNRVAGMFVFSAANGNLAAAVLPALAAMSVKQFTTKKHKTNYE